MVFRSSDSDYCSLDASIPGLNDPSLVEKYFLILLTTIGSSRIYSVFGLAAGETWRRVFINCLISIE